MPQSCRLRLCFLPSDLILCSHYLNTISKHQTQSQNSKCYLFCFETSQHYRRRWLQTSPLKPAQTKIALSACFSRCLPFQGQNLEVPCIQTGKQKLGWECLNCQQACFSSCLRAPAAIPPCFQGNSSKAGTQKG